MPVQRVSLQAAYEPFENGFMLWRTYPGMIIVFSQDGWYASYPDADYAALSNNRAVDYNDPL